MKQDVTSVAYVFENRFCDSVRMRVKRISRRQRSIVDHQSKTGNKRVIMRVMTKTRISKECRFNSGEIF